MLEICKILIYFCGKQEHRYINYKVLILAIPRKYIVLDIKSVLILLQIVLDNIPGILNLLTQIDAIIKTIIVYEQNTINKNLQNKKNYS